MAEKALTLNLLKQIATNNEGISYDWLITSPDTDYINFNISVGNDAYLTAESGKANVSVLEEVIEWDGKYDPLADTLERYSRERFVQADKDYFTKTGKHIEINEGSTREGNARRSCFRQAQLWMSYNLFKTPGSAAANSPGCSDHNYGLAIDLKNYNDVLREILINNGWTDEFPAEQWHFTCSGSAIFETVRKKIKELQTGKANEWRITATNAYHLNMQKNRMYPEITARHKKFEGEVAGFNKHAEEFNDAKRKFHTETDHLPQRRNQLFDILMQIDTLTKQAENSYVAFREISDEIITVCYQNMEEIRRMMSLPIDEIPAEFSRANLKIPSHLQVKYQTCHAAHQANIARLKAKHAEYNRLFEQFNGSLSSFEVKAIELMKQYNFLVDLRSTLEREKVEIERGYIQVQLLGQESMVLMGKSGQLLEEIQQVVDNVSPA